MWGMPVQAKDNGRGKITAVSWKTYITRQNISLNTVIDGFLKEGYHRFVLWPP